MKLDSLKEDFFEVCAEQFREEIEPLTAHVCRGYEEQDDHFFTTHCAWKDSRMQVVGVKLIKGRSNRYYIRNDLAKAPVTIMGELHAAVH